MKFYGFILDHNGRVALKKGMEQTWSSLDLPPGSSSARWSTREGHGDDQRPTGWRRVRTTIRRPKFLAMVRDWKQVEEEGKERAGDVVRDPLGWSGTKAEALFLPSRPRAQPAPDREGPSLQTGSGPEKICEQAEG